MDLLMRYSDQDPKSPAGLLAYVGEHLQGSGEARGLARIQGYLCRDGRVPPLVADPGLWRQVGWDPDQERLPPAELLTALTRGEDEQGRPLNASCALYRAPKELLVTVPCEVSVALLRLKPEAHADVIRSLHQAVMADLVAQGLPVQIKGSRTWQPARLLTLAYWHTENRDGEPHDHLHVLVFPPALNGAGQWRTFDNAGHVSRLAAPEGGRSLAMASLADACVQVGLTLNWVPGKASDRPGVKPGTTVTFIGGEQILAGSIPRERGGKAMAAREFKAEFGVAPLTPKELGWLRGGEGRPLASLVPKARLHAVRAKAQALGLVDDFSFVRKGLAFAAALQGATERLEAIHQRMQDVPTHGHRAAAPRVAQQLEGLRSLGGTCQELAVLPRRRRHWEMLAQVAEAGHLGTEGLSKSDRNLLVKLTSAGWLQAECQGRKAVYRVSPAGVLALRKQPKGLEQGAPSVEVRPPLKVRRFVAPTNEPKPRPMANDDWQPIRWARSNAGQPLTHSMDTIHHPTSAPAAEHDHGRSR